MTLILVLHTHVASCIGKWKWRSPYADLTIIKLRTTNHELCTGGKYVGQVIEHPSFSLVANMHKQTEEIYIRRKKREQATPFSTK